MQIHKFIDGEKPVMALIHGILTPWQIWEPQKWTDTVRGFLEKA